MQKVVGSSPIIRFLNPPEGRSLAWASVRECPLTNLHTAREDRSC
jgi:hypothetical protein